MRINLTWVACVLAAAGTARAQTATESVILSFANFPRGANPTHRCSPGRAALFTEPLPLPVGPASKRVKHCITACGGQLKDDAVYAG
jgi:hypothetical protein